jgi:nucleoid DNA-binding protein
MSTVKTTITKDYLARQLSYRNDISKEMGKKIIDHITEILADALAHGNEVEIRGLMSMTPYMSKAKVGRAGYGFTTSIEIPARKRVKVKISPSIIHHINNQQHEQQQQHDHSAGS